MFANIEHSQYSSLQQGSADYHHMQPSLRQTSREHNRRGERHKGCCGCGRFMWRLIDCFRNSGQEQIRSRTVVADATQHIAQYQAPVVTPSPRAGSASSCDDEQDFERGTLLPKRQTCAPEPGRPEAASTSSAAAAAAAAGDVGAEQLLQDHGRHRRTGSGGARGQLEGVRACILPAAAALSAAGGGAAGGKAAKYGGVSEAEFTTVAELLGADADEEDFCPTCLEPYSNDNPKIFTRCGHSFHMQCIYAWLERKSTCPLCERPMDLQDDIIL